MDVLTRLAAAAAAGDEGALQAFVSGSYDRVWRLCAALVDDQSADDLAQETFVRAVRAMPRFRGDASGLTWVLAVARHTCLDELRARGRRRRRQAALVALAGPGEPASADASHAATAFDLVRRLEPERRTAFVLTRMVGLSYEQAAEVCECPVGTIRSRVARARQDLVGFLGAVDALDAPDGVARGGGAARNATA